MPEYAISLVHRKDWNGGFIKDIEVTNTGGEPLTDFWIDVFSSNAELVKSWGGSHEYLGDGVYRLTFNDTLIEPGEIASLGFTASGTDDFALVGASEPPYEPDIGVTEISIGADTTAAELQMLIDGARQGTVIQLEAGRYRFDSTVRLDRDGVSVIGAGSGETVIDVAGLGQEAFAVGNGHRNGDYTLAGDVAEGSTVLELSGSHSFEAGDYLYLERESTETFYDEIGDTTWRRTDVPLRTSIVRVESVDGNTVALEGGVHFDFTSGETTVQEIGLVEYAALGGFTVDYGLGAADPAAFENTQPEYDRDAVIQVEGVAGLRLFDVTAHDVPSLGVNVSLSTNASVDAIEMAGAHNKGVGGNGYALQIRDVYDSSFSNLTDQDMRHSVVFASWRSAVGNQVHVASTDRDINFHGGRDHGNVVMVDRSIRNGVSDVMTPTLFVNTEGTSYGSPTDPNANTVLFGTVVGTSRADRIKGYDGGAWLDGRGGDDVLTGGAGNDWLIGGTGHDVLTGGGGEDVVSVDGSLVEYDLHATDAGWEVSRGSETDALAGVEWILFADKALQLSDLSLHDAAEVEGIFAGPAVWDPSVWNGQVGWSAPILQGTAGNDSFVVDRPGVIALGLDGWDTVVASVDFTMQEDVEKLVLTGTDAIDGNGSDTANLMQGNDADNILRSRKGADSVWGHDGDDSLRGGAAADRLHGGAGADILKGAAGADLLEGGRGADRFVFRTVGQSNPERSDVIVDFGLGADVIDLSAIDADTTQTGNQAFHLGGEGPGVLWLEADALLGDVDGDNYADLRIELGGIAIAGDDFIF